MRVPTPPLLAAILTSLLLAGCADGGGGGEEDLEAAFADLDLSATSTTGVIRGVVVDEAIRPVAGASVTLTAESPRTVKTDDAGLFGFAGLPAGLHFLAIEKLGYRATQQSVDVAAGVADPPIVKVLLASDPSSLPYVVAQSHEGYIQCSFKAANIVFDASYCDPGGATGLSRNDDSRPWFPVTGGAPDYFQSEMSWDTTQALGTSLVTIQFACDEDDCGETDTNRLCNVRGASPLVCRVNRTASSDGGEGGGGGHGIDESGLGNSTSGFSVQMFSNCFECVPGTVLGAGVVLEQRYVVVTHLFYGYEPPADWLFTRDGPPPPPPNA